MKHHKPSLLFRDVLMNVLLLFIAATIILLPHINPPTQVEDAIPPGTMNVEIRWEDARNVDVDLWVKAPGDPPVGFKRLGGKVFNLLRDDLGTWNDPLLLNYENAYSRGLPDGKYIVNVHYYRGTGEVVVASMVTIRFDSLKKEFSRSILLFPHEEKTLFRFHVAGGQVRMDNIFERIAPFD